MLDHLKKQWSNLKDKGKMAAAKKMMQQKGVPEAQQEMLLTLMQKNPELMEKIQKETEQLKKEGKGEMAASLIVMRKYQGELQKLMMKR